MDESLQARLLRLESAIAHLEHHHEQLNAVVVGQARVIEQLRREIARASQSMERQELERISAQQQKPPHYQ